MFETEYVIQTSKQIFDVRYIKTLDIKSFSAINCSCKDEGKSGEIFEQEYEELIKEIEMYKYHLDEGKKIPRLSCAYC